MANTYQKFLTSKRMAVPNAGLSVERSALNPILFDFQKDLALWALKKGRAAIFADTGLGKTFMQVEWARLIGGRVLIVAPLSVARQTVRESKMLDVSIHYTRHGDDLRDGLNITNYELLSHFDASKFDAVVLDESSLLKALDGKTRRKLTTMFGQTPYRLCCTATPAPNDYIELGNHAQFLGICSQAEMLAMFFVNANKQQAVEVDGRVYEMKGSNKGGTEWRLKHHAEERFFEWLATWAITLTKPSDLDYSDDGFILPPLTVTPHFVHVEYHGDGELFFSKLKGISDRVNARRDSLTPRLEKLTEIIKGSADQWIVWAGLDVEADAITKSLNAVQVKGSDTPESKAQAFEDFQDGKYQILVTKGRIGGFGMNFQNAHKMAFFGLSDSWETYYQCVRREWRYRQTSPVDVHIVMSDAEAAVYQNVMRKDALARRLREKLIQAVRRYELSELGKRQHTKENYSENTAKGEGWTLMNGDSCERFKTVATDSIDLSVYSPPFADLFTYSASERDLGNNRNWNQFFDHYAFIIREALRITKPGRLTCVHTSDIPAMASRDGYIGVRDFPGAVIKAYEAEGWVFVGRAFVQKNPQAQAIRVKSKALLFVQLRKDSADSRPALVDQILLFRKPGENAVPVNPVGNGEMDNETWIEWAHGIWLGIRETDTLQYSQAREVSDEKHICPLQLGVIERCIKLWSNPGELVASFFAGIGSEGYMAVKLRRRFLGCELKKSYFDVAVTNLQHAERDANADTLFSGLEETA